MEQLMDQKTQTIHKRLDAFELQVLERSASTIDLATFQTKLASLRADVDTFLAPPDSAPEVAPTKEADTVVMYALFGNSMPPPNFSRVAGKLPRSDCTTDTEEAHR
uniref:Integrase core domain containing protein n=1 Tax=Solanum tuberosum TaxID=4113 RepID=M1D9P5_SOLTU